jgi:hypothetical protein
MASLAIKITRREKMKFVDRSGLERDAVPILTVN